VIEVKLPDGTLANVRVNHTNTLRAGEAGTVLKVVCRENSYELDQRLPRSVRRGLYA
jgi:hypothetical protein